MSRIKQLSQSQSKIDIKKIISNQWIWICFNEKNFKI